MRQKKEGAGVCLGKSLIGNDNGFFQPFESEARNNSDDNRKKHIRILPAFVMHPILEGAILVMLIKMLVLRDLGFVEEFVVEAEHFLILLEHR